MEGGCSGCGAPINPALSTCEFCGAATAAIGSPADEQKAFREVTEAAQRLAQQTFPQSEDTKPYSAIAVALACVCFWPVGLFLLFRNARSPAPGDEKRNRLAQFWQNAFIPTTPDVQAQAGMHALALIQAGFDGRQAMIIGRSARAEANQVYLTRAENILNAMKIGGQSDAGTRGKMTQLEKAIKAARTKMAAGKTKSRTVALCVVGGMAALWILAVLPAMFGAGSDDMPGDFVGVWKGADRQLLITAGPDMQVQSLTGTALGKYDFRVRESDGVSIKVSGSFEGEGIDSYCSGTVTLANNSSLIIVNLDDECQFLNGQWQRWNPAGP